ncbi:DUF6615 family protein [Rhizobium sp. BK176]|uniref:DUF6615 family protein n=1 Tax=Rhizobium sp. BK176 TaxID=2587071 RepID=UPI00216841BD|nr:DUF6615 family protein [Rhizobium sp. BK176]MCS4091359.1 hypothetical protein [Rhizobium sp. BK176]
MLCQFSLSIPGYVEGFLDHSRSMGRSFREETVTDLIMSGIFSASSPLVRVRFPNELITGADMQWTFVDVARSRSFRILLQAKRAEGTSKNWKVHRYEHLDYRPRTATGLQVETLCATARKARTPTYPMYIFYNPLATTELSRSAGKFHIDGVNIAGGYHVEAIVKAGITSKGVKTKHKNLDALSHLFRPLSDLFCPSRFSITQPGSKGPGTTSFATELSEFALTEPPSPDEMRERVLRLHTTDEAMTKAYDMPIVSDVADEIPDDIHDLIQPFSRAVYSRIAPRKKVDVWQAVFISNAGPKYELRRPRG